MIRFRNPVSDINILIANFKKMYVDFSSMDFFDLDNIAEFFAREKLASSSGYIGDEALKRSYMIKDDSRKSMKMQAKSYAELFRFLGWISSGDKALNFNFTYLGIHIATSGDGAISLFEQCLLGISYPNHILDVKFDDINKPFINMLIFAKSLNGKINRDEIILGPMNLSNGYSDEVLYNKIEYIKNIRSLGRIDILNNQIKMLADENGMQVVSVRNLTRFVMSSLKFSGWFKEEKLKVYGVSSSFLVLTEKGYNAIETIENAVNINGDELDISKQMTKEISEYALLCMFNRAGFDVEDEINKYSSLIGYLQKKYGKSEVLFSPYQYFSKEELEIVLPQNSLITGTERRNFEVDTDKSAVFSKNEVSINAKDSNFSENTYVDRKLLSLIRDPKFDENIEINIFLDTIKTMKQSDFYPLVANLLGYIFNRPSIVPSAGNNNMRYDVLITDICYSIPVEVKSPTEEEMLSVKAIRQALENKILLLARKPYNTTFEVSSLACGYKLPNNRSDVYKLIEEIYAVYGINIAILDMETLIRACFYCAKTRKYYDISEFKNVRGVIKFES